MLSLIHAVTQEVSSRAEPPDLSQLTEIVYGASPIRPDLLERAVALPGYWNDPEATARSLTADGFYRTGDVGIIGPDGYLTIVDQLSDLVITGGENVYPAEVEAVLAAHPAVADVVVIGVPDEWWGETVHAVVVLASGALLAPTGKVLRAALRQPFWAGRDRLVS